MFSMPRAMAVSSEPIKISCAAAMIACAPAPQTRFTVMAGDLDWQSGVDRRLPCGIHFVAGFYRIPHDHCADLIRPQARPLKSSADGCRSRLGGWNILQRAAEYSDGCANRFGNHDRMLRYHGKTSAETMNWKNEMTKCCPANGFGRATFVITFIPVRNAHADAPMCCGVTIPGRNG